MAISTSNRPLDEPNAFATPAPSAPVGNCTSPLPSAPPDIPSSPLPLAPPDIPSSPLPSAPPKNPWLPLPSALPKHSSPPFMSRPFRAPSCCSMEEYVPQRAPTGHAMKNSRRSLPPLLYATAPAQHAVPPTQEIMVATGAERENGRCLEWHGSEMLGITHDGVAEWYYRQHPALTACSKRCSYNYNFFSSPESSLSYEARGKCCFQTYHFATNDEETATLTPAKCCDNGCAYAVGLVVSAPPIITLGTINVRGKPRFRILRHVDKELGKTWEFRSPCKCMPPPAYAIINQSIYDAPSALSRTIPTSPCLRERDLDKQANKLRQPAREWETLGVDEKLKKKTITQRQSESEKFATWLTMLGRVGRSESLFRRVGCLCLGWWEPVRMKIIPDAQELTMDEIRALGLVPLAHLADGLNGPLLRKSNGNVGTTCQGVSFKSMLLHKARYSVSKESVRNSASVCSGTPIRGTAASIAPSISKTSSRPPLFPESTSFRSERQ